MAYVINANLNYAGDPVTHLFSVLRQRLAARVDVRIILDDPPLNRPNFHCNHFMRSWLREWQIPHGCPRRKESAHAKMIICDDTSLFIGSHNLAKSSLLNTMEITAEIRDPLFISDAAQIFLDIWDSTNTATYLPPFIRNDTDPVPWMYHGKSF
jgi:phosphatidylserine/phosphatidylglycerophosphate/cardiolipin synthase-like enzyme